MNLKDFKKLSIEEQNKIKNDLSYDLCILNMSSDDILAKYNICYSTFRHLKKIFNINRTKEQDYALKAQSNKKKQKETTKKMMETKLKRYGCSGYNNIEKIKKTNLEKYGVENVYSSKQIKEKKKESYLKHYGYDHPMKNPEFKQNYIENRLLKNNGFWNNNIAQIMSTKINKYGIGQFSIIEKIKNTKLERYGNPVYVNPEKCKETWNNKTKEEINNIANKRIKTNVQRYGIENTWLLSTHNSISKINYNFSDILNELNISHELEYRIKNRKYDIKINNILIEINPTYTHNSTYAPIFFKKDKNNKPLSKTYHLEKSQLAIENGFRCIHIWDWDNWDKIINLLLPKQKMYARKCELKEVSKKECDEFLNIYHLQNTCNGQKIRYGLYYNNELVQIMTFGKPRYNKNYEWELLRLCSHKDYIVVGGSQKLFKHFLKMQKPNNIISYCDNSKFSGDVYLSLGMIKVSNGAPTINWSKGIERITNNLLNQRGYDQLFKTNFGKGTSNRDLMIENGWREVYDCGQSVYEWKLNNK